MGKKTALVVKDNVMLSASCRMTLVEQQIILYSIVQARETQKGLSDADFVTIAALEFGKQFGTNVDNVYRDLKAAAETMFGRRFLVPCTNPITGKPDVFVLRWVSAINYIEDAGIVRLRFAPDAIPYLTRLERNFTQYNLDAISSLSSIHAVRMYELLVQYLPLGTRTFEITNLRFSLGLGELEYASIKDFKLKVLEIAVSQINERTDINTGYIQHKTGRTVTHFTFSIAAKQEQKKPPKPTAAPTPTPAPYVPNKEVAALGLAAAWKAIGKTPPIKIEQPEEENEAHCEEEEENPLYQFRDQIIAMLDDGLKPYEIFVRIEGANVIPVTFTQVKAYLLTL